LAAKADTTVDHKEASTPLYYACRLGNAKEGQDPFVLALLRAKADPNQGCSDITPLHKATEKGRYAAMAHLIHHGADIEARNYCGGTPLIVAADLKRYNATDLLLSFKADVHAVDYYGRTALDYAVGSAELRLIQLL